MLSIVIKPKVIITGKSTNILYTPSSNFSYLLIFYASNIGIKLLSMFGLLYRELTSPPFGVFYFLSLVFDGFGVSDIF